VQRMESAGEDWHPRCGDSENRDPAAFESLLAFLSHSAGLVEKLNIHLTASELESEAALFVRSCKSVKELEVYNAC
jgi:hypothetical protein